MGPSSTRRRGRSRWWRSKPTPLFALAEEDPSTAVASGGQCDLSDSQGKLLAAALRSFSNTSSSCAYNFSLDEIAKKY